MFHFLLLSAFPTSPIVKNSGPSLMGEIMKLTCTAQDVFPANLFQILWMDGEREMHSETGSFSSGTINLTSVYSYRVNTEDQDRCITCKVLLEMSGVPAAQTVKMASTTLSVHCKSRYFFVSFKNEFALGFKKLCSFDRSPESNQDYCEPTDGIEGRKIREHFLPFRQLSSGAYGAEQGDGWRTNRANDQWWAWNIVYHPFGRAGWLWHLFLWNF